jgi:hypothetical protein
MACLIALVLAAILVFALGLIAVLLKQILDRTPSAAIKDQSLVGVNGILPPDRDSVVSGSRAEVRHGAPSD